jgi:hypothetical protein
MQNTKSFLNEQESSVTSKLNNFFYEFQINKILRGSKISKLRGIKVQDILIKIIELPFIQKNFYRGIVLNKEIGFNKSVAYDLLNNEKYNWRLFLYKIVVIIINHFLKPLTGADTEDVLILDDSSHPRNRSKKVELLANQWDHVTNTFYKGYRLFQLCWSDGRSLIPIEFTLLSSSNEDSRIQGMNEKLDKRSCGYKRRLEAISKSTDLIVPFVKRAIKKGIKAKYLLMDTWFGFPAVISAVRVHIEVICMVKDTPKIFYYQAEKSLTLKAVYTKVKKRRGKAVIKGSEIVDIKSDRGYEAVKIVFVKNRNKKRCWLAILSTDILLSDAEIVRIYGKRWDIEVFFKIMKSCLNLNHEVELRNYYGMIAHTTIVLLRYIFLAVEQRTIRDSKTLGGIFFETIEEMKDISLIEALTRILTLAIEKIRELPEVTKKLVDEIIMIFMGLALEKFKLIPALP